MSGQACTCVENVQRYGACLDDVMRDCEVHPYDGGCRATFEPVPPNERGGTHTCTLGADHPGPHVCPTCKSEWEAVMLALAPPRVPGEEDLREELGYDCDLCADPEWGPPIPDAYGPLLHTHHRAERGDG